MRKFNKEIKAILGGMVFAYAWQLVVVFMSYVSSPDSITTEMFIPVITIQITKAPMGAWFLMGIYKVSWMKTWVRITACGMAFAIPFALIAMVTLFICPMLWHELFFWGLDIIVSGILTLTLFKPVSKIRWDKDKECIIY